MRCPLVVGEAVSTCHIVHAFEVGEEVLEGFEMGQSVSDLHASLVVCARGYAQNAVVSAKLSVWRLKRIRKIDLADDGRVFTSLAFSVDFFMADPA